MASLLSSYDYLEHIFASLFKWNRSSFYILKRQKRYFKWMFKIAWNFLFTFKPICCFKFFLIVWQQQYHISKKVYLFKLDNLVIKIDYYDTTLSNRTSYRTIVPIKTKGYISYK